MKALNLLTENTNYAQKAESFTKSAKESCEDILRTKERSVTAIEDRISDGERSLSISTDINKGIIEQTRSDINGTFKTLMGLRHQLVLAQLELKSYQDSFNHYFNELQ